MADDISIRFSAQIGELTDGVDKIKSSVDSLGSHFTSLAGIFGAAFSIDGIKNFVESMSALGSQTESIAARLGVSNQSVVEFSGLAKLAGVDIGTFAQEMERATQNVQKSTKDAFNPAAQALSVLHLNAQSLIGLPADQYFLKIADAVSKFTPSLNLTNAVTTAFGRTMSNLLPVLLQGREHLLEFQQGWDRASVGIAAAVPGMADTHEKLLLLGQSTESFGARVFSTFKPAIDAAVTAVTGWLQGMDTAKIQTFAVSITDTLANALISVASFFGAASVTASELGTEIEDLITHLKNLSTAGMAIGAAAGGLFGGPAGAVGGALLGGALLSDGGPGLSSLGTTGALNDEYGQIGEAVAAGNQKLGAAVTQGGAQTAAKVGDAQKTIIDRIREMQAAIKAAFSQQPLDITKMLGGGQNAGAINEGAANAATAAAAQYAAMIEQAKGAFAVLKEQYSTDAAVHKITVDQETAQLQAALAERWEIEQAVFGRELALYAQGSAQYNGVLKTQQAAYQAYLKEHQALTDTQLKADVAEWNSALSPIVGAWNSQLRGLLSGTESWSTAMKKIVGDLVIQVIEYFEKIAVEKAALGLASMTGAGPTSMLGGLLGGGGTSAATLANTSSLDILNGNIITLNGLLGGTAAATTASSAATTANTAGTAVNTGGLLANTSAALSSVGSWIANTLATLANTISTDAAAIGHLIPFAQGSWSVPHTMPALVHKGEMIVPAEGGHAAAMRQMLGGFSFPKFDLGTDYVASGGFAQIHAGEAIIPARGSGAFTGDGMGGDTHHHYNVAISAVDSRSVERLFSDNKSAMFKALKEGMKHGMHTNHLRGM